MGLTTQIDAVNEILSAIGEDPVSSLDTSNADVNLALQRMEQCRIQILERGLWFNQTNDYELTPNGSGEYDLPADTLSVRVTAAQSPAKRWTERGGKLYNITDQTFTGNTETQECVLIQDQPFDELPEAARQLIMVMAARKFADRIVGAAELHRFAAADELAARSRLFAEHLRQKRTNALNSPAARRTLDRRR